MRILGVSLTSTYAALVTIEISNGGWDLIDTSSSRKFELGDHEDATTLRSFSSAIQTFINSHAIDKIIIRRCTYKGQHRSGAGAIKMEALLQLMNVDVTLIASQTVSMHFKKHGVVHPRGINQYQHDAFESALFGVPL